MIILYFELVTIYLFACICTMQRAVALLTKPCITKAGITVNGFPCAN